MVNADRLDPVIPQEPCHPGMMGTLGPLIVESPPGDRELLPVADLAAGHLGGRDPAGPPPARVNLAIGGDRQLQRIRGPYPHAAGRDAHEKHVRYHQLRRNME